MSQRYTRPFSLARVTFSNLDALRHELGALAAENAYLVALHTIIGVLRASDFAGTHGANMAILGFPETAAAEVRDAILERLRETVPETTRVPIELGFDLAEGSDIASMLAEG